MSQWVIHQIGEPEDVIEEVVAEELGVSDVLQVAEAEVLGMRQPTLLQLRPRQSQGVPKLTHAKVFISQNKAECVFEFIHCDIWGPYREPSSCGAHYFLTIVDDTIRTTWVYLMREKGEASKLIKNFIVIAYTQFDKRLKWCVETTDLNLPLTHASVLPRAWYFASKQLCLHTLTKRSC